MTDDEACNLNYVGCNLRETKQIVETSVVITPEVFVKAFIKKSLIS